MIKADPTTAQPCPHCGNAQPRIFSGHELVAQCHLCGLMAPISVWNSLTKKTPWHYPQNNLDLPNMPAPGQIVVGYYYDGDAIRGPVIMTPIHVDGSHIDAKGMSIYCPLVRWCAIPAE
jgi:hypothetical protein